MKFTEKEMNEFKTFNGTLNEYKRLMMGRTSIFRIFDTVGKYYGLTHEEISKKSMVQKYAYPRHIAKWFCYYYTKHSTEKIGKYAGNRDHTTVIMSKDKINGFLSYDKNTVREVDEISAILSCMGIERIYGVEGRREEE